MKIFTSHRPLVLIPQNKQSVNITLSHIWSHIFLQNMAADDVSKTTHIYNSTSPDQLISARSNMEFIPSEVWKTDKQKTQNMSYKSPKHGNKSKKIINNLAL